MPERDADESPIDQRPPADAEPAAQLGDAHLIPAEDEAAGHACQPPRELPPDPGARWRCPECGRMADKPGATEREHVPGAGVC